MPWLSILVSSLEGMEPPLYRWWGSLFCWVGAFCIREVDKCSHSSWHGGNLPVSLPLFFCLALPTMTQFHDWFAFLLWFTICQHQGAWMSFPLPYVCVPSKVCSHITSPVVFPILSGCSSRCPQQKPQLPVFPSQGSFTGRLLGDCLTTFLS